MTRRDDQAAIDRLVAEALPALREMAEQEHERRQGLLLPRPVSLLLLEQANWLNRRLSEHGELDYRRGYMHGYGAAMEDLRAAVRGLRGFAPAWAKVAAFFDGRLHDWRYRRARTNRDVPPQFHLVQAKPARTRSLERI